jgi:hypothetical protein
MLLRQEWRGWISLRSPSIFTIGTAMGVPSGYPLDFRICTLSLSPSGTKRAGTLKKFDAKPQIGPPMHSKKELPVVPNLPLGVRHQLRASLQALMN